MFKPEDENINRSGRPKGSLNKSTIALAKVRESFADFVGFTFEQIQEDWQKFNRRESHHNQYRQRCSHLDVKHIQSKKMYHEYQ